MQVESLKNLKKVHLESLKVFCDIARYRSFSQAAQANDLTQSAASQIVGQLEKRLGVQLIDRSTRPLQLTPLGQAYYDGCKDLVEQYTELEASIRRAHSQLAATVQVAAIYSVGLGDMGQVIERFETQHPGARVHIEYLHPNRVYDKVLAGTADIGLVSFPRASRKLNALAWREEPMVLACPPRHPLARQAAVYPAQLAGQKYIGFDRDLTIRREIDRFLREQGATVEVVLEFDNIENIKKAVEVSAGVALLPEPTLRREVEAGTLVAVPLAGARLVRPLGIIHRRHHKLSANALRFIDLLRQAEGLAPTGTEKADSDRTRPRSDGAHRSRNGAHRGSRRTV
ncbi:MAG TPA: LysR family transcriptional regulator [Gemmataceae bacterium]|nr:LysR family transcriptional regulator [Gemmataceae bacterium]